jgi:hypothetical protein
MHARAMTVVLWVEREDETIRMIRTPASVVFVVLEHAYARWIASALLLRESRYLIGAEYRGNPVLISHLHLSSAAVTGLRRRATLKVHFGQRLAYDMIHS